MVQRRVSGESKQAVVEGTVAMRERGKREIDEAEREVRAGKGETDSVMGSSFWKEQEPSSIVLEGRQWDGWDVGQAIWKMREWLMMAYIFSGKNEVGRQEWESFRRIINQTSQDERGCMTGHLGTHLRFKVKPLSPANTGYILRDSSHFLRCCSFVSQSWNHTAHTILYPAVLHFTE